MIHESKTQLPPSQLTLNDVRAKLSGLHFSKETLSKGEREILLLAETLLTYIDKTPETPEPFDDVPSMSNNIVVGERLDW